MTLDEAIAHAKEVAKEKKRQAGIYEDMNPITRQHLVGGCLKCAEEHEQLAEWLEELKQIKEQKE